MAFSSAHHKKIWDSVHSVSIPDFASRNPDYIRRFGGPRTGVKEIDKMMSNNFISVMIPIIRIAEYFDAGLEVQIPSRDTMLLIHSHIKLYLSEWEEHITRSINNHLDDATKEMLEALDRLAEHIHAKIKPREHIAAKPRVRFGLQSPLNQAHSEAVELDSYVAPDYSGITNLINNKPRGGPGRF